MHRRFHARLALAFAFLLAACCASALALERVTLRNGFSYDCARTETLSDGQVRLYFGAPSPLSTANYMDFPADRIGTVDTLPDPPRVLVDTAVNAASNTDVPSLLAHAGSAHNIDTELLASVVHAESGGHAAALSRAGAQGLMQLMPATARELGVHDAFAPAENIDGGTAYLDLLLSRYHDDLALALAAYNAGPAAVDRFHGVPPFRETRLYVVRVINEFKRRKLALQQAATGVSASTQTLRAAR